MTLHLSHAPYSWLPHELRSTSCVCCLLSTYFSPVAGTVGLACLQPSGKCWWTKKTMLNDCSNFRDIISNREHLDVNNFVVL